ncbi:MAG: hypothetical protein ABIB71_07975 [Candidatus Woesearchaeota archaeon]
MDLDTTVRKIKSLQIQGASNISRAALLAFSSFAASNKKKSEKDYFKALEKAKHKLFLSRTTEPGMRNYLNYFEYLLKKKEGVKEMKESAPVIAKKVLAEWKSAKDQLARIGLRVIPKNALIFTHCHSTSVTGIIRAARGKRVTVHNTETRPLFQGRLTAMELAKAKIPVKMFVDSAARLALKKADVMLIGADSITSTAVYNKIGSELIAEVANKYDIPVYVCSTSWKFNPDTLMGFVEEVEQRSSKEVWEKPPKGVKIENPAFEKVSPEMVTAIISELGVLKHEAFIEEAKKKHNWMLS